MQFVIGSAGSFRQANNSWWGRQDSNLRSHEAADLQSAPFATRDTPPAAMALAVHRRRRRSDQQGQGDGKAAGPVGRAARPGRLWANPPCKVNQGDGNFPFSGLPITNF